MRARPALAIAVAASLLACGGAGAPRDRPQPDTVMPAAETTAAAPETPDDRARRVWREAITIDMHNDMPTKMLDEGYDPDVRNPPGFAARSEGHTDLPRLLESGLTAVFLAAWVDAPYARRTPDASHERALAGVDSIRAFAARHPERTLLATTADDVRRAKREGRLAILVGVEGGHAIEASLDKLRTLHGRGVRYLTLTWNNGNQWAGSSIGVDGTRTGGLTPFGREVIREMNRLGMLVDVSHVSDATLDDVIAASSAPVIASHSSARELAEHPRNLTDDQLRAIARTGGVVNVNFFSRFIDQRHLDAWEAVERGLEAADARRRAAADPDAAEAEFAATRRRLLASLPATPFSVIVDHIDHVAKVAGAAHVGIGSDFDGVSALPDGMEDVTALPRLAGALLDRGWDEAEVRGMLGGNMLRVMDRVLRASP